MNKLLSDYESARKAIFEHCGVDRNTGDNLQIRSGERWHYRGHLLEIPTYQERFSVECSPYRGPELTTVLVEVLDCSLEWLVLDNALELK